jgi:hypothetical protein
MSESEYNSNVFQDGVFGYSASADADIRGSSADPDTAIREWNQGAQNVLRSGRRPAGSPTDEIYRTLIRFDVSLLSDASKAANVFLELTGFQHSTDPTEFTATYDLYRVLRPWGEGNGLEGKFPTAGEVSWSYSAFPAQWSLPGVRHASDSDPLADREATLLASHNITNALGSRVRLSSRALREVVKDWIDDPSSNHGLVLIARDEAFQHVVNLASRDHVDPWVRPRLVVDSREAAARPANQPPIARNDIVYLASAQPTIIDVLANDSDPDNGPVAFHGGSLAALGAASHGITAIDDGRVSYTPDPGWMGLDEFTYDLSDGAEIATATVKVLTAPPRYGNVNASTGNLSDVVFVNSQAGSGLDRRITLSPLTALSMSVNAPPSRSGMPTNFVLYLWISEEDMAVAAPFGLGLTVLATPLTDTLSPQPNRIANNIGYPNILGAEKWPGPPTNPAPTGLLDAPAGINQVVTFQVQGIIRDPAALNGVAAITNGIVVEVR